MLLRDVLPSILGLGVRGDSFSMFYCGCCWKRMCATKGYVVGEQIVISFMSFKFALFLSSTFARNASRALPCPTACVPIASTACSAPNARNGWRGGTSWSAQERRKGVPGSSATFVTAFDPARTWKATWLRSTGSRTGLRILWGPWLPRLVVAIYVVCKKVLTASSCCSRSCFATADLLEIVTLWFFMVG